MTYQIRPETMASLKKAFPTAIILAHSTECLDYPHSKIGMVINVDEKLHAILAMQGDKDKSWKIYDLDRDVDYTHGGMKDFLNDYMWGHQIKYDSLQYMEVRCAVPNKDRDISTRANGEYINGFKPEKDAYPPDDTCFTASDVYSSWVCYRVDKKTGKPVVSFVQMNAD